MCLNAESNWVVELTVVPHARDDEGWAGSGQRVRQFGLPEYTSVYEKTNFPPLEVISKAKTSPAFNPCSRATCAGSVKSKELAPPLARAFTVFWIAMLTRGKKYTFCSFYT